VVAGAAKNNLRVGFGARVIATNISVVAETEMANGRNGSRIARLRKKVAGAGLEGVVLAPGPNIEYYTGVRSQLLERVFLLFVPSDGDPQLVAPTLESGPYARSPVKMGIHSWDDAGGPSGAFTSLQRQLKLHGRWACEGRVPFGYLSHVLPTGIELVSGDRILQSIREVKDESELDLLRQAARILGKAYLKVPELLHEGMTEIELSGALREQIFALGGETVDFCMVQAGEHAADPHWAPSKAKILSGMGVVIDAGCTLSGYNADITRTFLLGRNPRFEEAYGSVLAAQKKGVAAVAPGRTVGEVDKATRDPLVKKGLGQYFFHRTGHGLGLEIHEEPYIVAGGRKRLKTGMVFTVEPGVYHAGKFGVRIEDNVVVTDRGCDVITRSVPKEFGWWR
jgi:Xaa-Pro aminopeptidase